ncbi:DUF1778 domain-containing protein [Cellulomonas shaoxiangyii]|uniref:DUF1778 domain-containing protein n=1 Tax=Cellulomonas shaoxiangyii TaxID=2566013 RepID=A0A4P7SNY7_9CELL|nr:DUF1778 domain-containing protein [Cellulomonas shaoxiangyii]QCB94674.1 DUF1778 domain-containing protein [Cellulomonas shaoxiangyii]TGY84727.1 DUF1778 domain-containing protein [Cellulomonas shaoxiangyii]
MVWGEHIPLRTARLHMRLTEEGLALLRQAAAVQEQDVTSFVLGVALDRARDVVTRENALRVQMAVIAADPLRYVRDPRVPDDPELAALVLAVRHDPDGLDRLG